MGIITWIILGAFSGWIASKIMKTDAEQDGLGNIMVGIFGAVIGGAIMSFVNKSGVNGLNLHSALVSIAGACVLIFVIKQFKTK